MKVAANGLSFEVEDSGPAGAASPVLLVMGLGMQLTAWPQSLVDALVAAGHRVIRFDNRDIGLSTWLDHLGVPNLLWESMKLRLGLPVRAPYALTDLAADAFGVLDALGVASAHVVGASMGGMIAQRMALAAPQRVRTLASIMSSSGARGLPGPQARVLQVMMSRPKDRSEPAVLAHYVRLFQAIGSPGYPEPEPVLRQRILDSVRRGGYHPAGSARQLAAVAADTTRAQALRELRVPTLVVHGAADPLVPVACGEDTARRIPGARLVTVPGMGHDLPQGVVERLLPPLLEHLRLGSP
ncbi:alpha/beta fold hydrolase [Ramlibacter alkalitolerans]|uniref:Alpha/beta fold hydrolase n=1 Tax=Ramlibacter alkalitolerans TaxID=2039631 RepID=A0ABS1JPD3_9BURK|nr:alpha/beta fold hydrolase [Ramlibacter alkalitolerans]MBL0426129.1 alpha/beta fold hydrolase [Ramlibacter alkalitolerans]